MAKSVHNDVLDAALNYIKNNCTRLVVADSALIADPPTYANVNTSGGDNLADVTCVSGDFTVADGDVSGRKLTIAQFTAFNVDVSGTAGHICLLDVANSKVLYTTTCTNQALTSGNTVTVPTWKIEIADPT